MAPSPQFWDSGRSTQISALIAANVNAGTTFGPTSYWLYNDKGALLGATKLSQFRIRPVVFDGANWATSGFPVLDEAWVQIRFTGIDNTGDATMLPQTTSFTPVGPNRPFFVYDIAQNCGRSLDVQIIVPSGANNVTQEVHLEIITDESSVIVATNLGRVAGAGVVSEWLDSSIRRLSTGRVLTAAGTAVVTIAKGGWNHDGTPRFRIQETLTLNQTAADGALTAGQSYVATISQPANSAPVATKSNRSASPSAPAVPGTDILLGYVTVAYQVGGTSIINSGNVDTSAVVRGEFSAVAGAGLNVTVGLGQAITIADTLVVRTSQSAVAITPSATTYVWLLTDGTFTITASVSPAFGAILLCVATASGVAVTSVDDSYRVRAYHADEYIMELKYPGPAAPATDIDYKFLPFDAVLERYSVQCAAESTTAANITFDIKAKPIGNSSWGTVFPSSGTQDLRPNLPGQAGGRYALGADHETRSFSRFDAFNFTMVSPFGDPSQHPADISVLLHFRRK